MTHLPLATSGSWRLVAGAGDVSGAASTTITVPCSAGAAGPVAGDADSASPATSRPRCVGTVESAAVNPGWWPGLRLRRLAGQAAGRWPPPPLVPATSPPPAAGGVRRRWWPRALRWPGRRRPPASSAAGLGHAVGAVAALHHLALGAAEAAPDDHRQRPPTRSGPPGSTGHTPPWPCRRAPSWSPPPPRRHLLRRRLRPRRPRARDRRIGRLHRQGSGGRFRATVADPHPVRWRTRPGRQHHQHRFVCGLL